MSLLYSAIFSTVKRTLCQHWTLPAKCSTLIRPNKKETSNSRCGESGREKMLLCTHQKRTDNMYANNNGITFHLNYNCSFVIWLSNAKLVDFTLFDVTESSFEGLGRVCALLETQVSSLSLIQKALADRQYIRSPPNRYMRSGVLLEIRGKILCKSSLGRFPHESGMTRSLVISC